jgi:soluble lytic murein transglycosylase-like protein
MIIKSGVPHFLFACIVAASGAAQAQEAPTPGDRHPEPIQVQDGAASPRHAARHQKTRRLQTREVSMGLVDGPAFAVRADASEGQSGYAGLIAAKAAAHGIPAGLANAVVRVESNYNARITGRAGEVGLMQIKYQTARGLGYTGTRAALYDPATNLEWGMRYLAGAQRLAGGSLCGTLAKYQGGHGTRGARTSGNYCDRVRTALSARGA